ncbi:hypothetical protein AB5J49_18805 [Streptomyces sp. R28]|uniref:Uncharacterized protein n=1 Tax=Streptomyces sp. R28 TaxID=3238628 RepID=A0AB39PXT8_9ACTN
MIRSRATLILVATGAAVAVAVAVALLLGGPFGDERVEHADGKGPLSSQSSSGTTSVYAPKNVPWTATFGSFLLCSADGDPLTIDGVRYRAPVKPTSVALKLRTVTPRMWKDTVDAGWIGAAVGQPPHFQNREAPGHYENVRAGARITQRCADQKKDGAGFTELLFVLGVGRQGGYIDAAWVDYHAGGKPYTLRLEWKMVACGSRIPHTVDGTVVCDGRQS